MNACNLTILLIEIHFHWQLTGFENTTDITLWECHSSAVPHKMLKVALFSNRPIT